MACTEDEDFLMTKKAWGLVCSTIGLLMCVVFRLTMSYIGTLNKINSKLFEYERVSIEDFTVTGRIDPNLYRRVVTPEATA